MEVLLELAQEFNMSVEQIDQLLNTAEFSIQTKKKIIKKRSLKEFICYLRIKN